jgi:hypothetical protein
MLIIMAVQAAVIMGEPIAAPPAPPSPPRMSMVQPPPRIMMTPRLGQPDRRGTLDVTVRSPEGLLWKGPLVVGNRGQSGWTQTKSEPADPACIGRDSYFGGDRDMLSVQLSLASEDPASIGVTARWARPDQASCGGTRTVEIRSTVSVPDRGSATVSGDGGLVIELHRR